MQLLGPQIKDNLRIKFTHVKSLKSESNNSLQLVQKYTDPHCPVGMFKDCIYCTFTTVPTHHWQNLKGHTNSQQLSEMPQGFSAQAAVLPSFQSCQTSVGVLIWCIHTDMTLKNNKRHVVDMLMRSLDAPWSLPCLYNLHTSFAVSNLGKDTGPGGISC